MFLLTLIKLGTRIIISHIYQLVHSNKKSERILNCLYIYKQFKIRSKIKQFQTVKICTLKVKLCRLRQVETYSMLLHRHNRCTAIAVITNMTRETENVNTWYGVLHFSLYSTQTTLLHLLGRVGFEIKHILHLVM